MDPGGLRIEGITGGIVGEWNARHPEAAVQPGDMCVEVNGVRGSGEALIGEIKKSSVLKMLFVRASGAQGHEINQVASGQPKTVVGNKARAKPGASAAPAALPEGNFLVEAAKPPNSSLGVDAEMDPGGLYVAAVTGGIVGEWNSSHPQATVQPGDMCVEVNGVRGPGEALAAEIKRSSMLRMVFARQAGSSGAGPAGTSGEPSLLSADYWIEIARPPRSILGVDIEMVDGRLVVSGVTGGVVGEWNARHPDRAVRPGDTCVEVNGVRGAGKVLVAEIKKSALLKMAFIRGSGAEAAPPAPPPPPRVTSEDILADIDAAERAVYGHEFNLLSSGQAKVMVDDKALREFLQRITAIRRSQLDMELVKHAPDLRIDLDAVLRLVREHPASEEVGISAFMDIAPDGKAEGAEVCRRALPGAVALALGKDPSDTQSAWLFRAAGVAVPRDVAALDLPAWLKAYRLCVRMTRLRRQVGA